MPPIHLEYTKKNGRHFGIEFQFIFKSLTCNKLLHRSFIAVKLWLWLFPHVSSFTLILYRISIAINLLYVFPHSPLITHVAVVSVCYDSCVSCDHWYWIGCCCRWTAHHHRHSGKKSYRNLMWCRKEMCFFFLLVSIFDMILADYHATN